MIDFQKKHIVYIITLCLIILFFFFLLLKINPEFVSHIPFIGNSLVAVNSISTSSSGTDTTTPDDSGKQNSFSVGSDHGASSLQPLTGKTLSPPGAYKDGVWTGIATLPDGVLILKATTLKGVLTNISFLTLPKDASQSILDTLATEAIKNQIVEVSPVSGYDDLSTGFSDALSNALQKSFKVTI